MIMARRKRHIPYDVRRRRDNALEAGWSALRKGINTRTIKARIKSLYVDLDISERYGYNIRRIGIIIRILFWRLILKIRANIETIMGVIGIIAVVIVLAFCITKIVHNEQEFKHNDYGRNRAYIMYTVQSDESLWSIAEELIKINPEYRSVRAYVYDIASCNSNIYTDSELKYGQRIMIPIYVNTQEQVDILDKYQIDLYQYRDTDDDVLKITGDR